LILGLETQTFAKCFVEIDDAVRAMTDRPVCFNAHRSPPPPGAIIYNLENVPKQVPDPATLWAGHEVWDFSASNAAKYGAKHVPVGYHPSMERFKRAPVLDIDVVFSGAINPRRAQVLNELQSRGLRVVIVPQRFYGRQRDAILARAKLALNMLFYEDGVFPALRVAHLVANRVPVLSERCPEQWNYVPHCDYESLATTVENAIKYGPEMAEHCYRRFVQQPLELPS
jgi:hypothetical protein